MLVSLHGYRHKRTRRNVGRRKSETTVETRVLKATRMVFVVQGKSNRCVIQLSVSLSAELFITEAFWNKRRLCG